MARKTKQGRNNGGETGMVGVVVAVPQPTLRRLPAYLQALEQLKSQGREWASCTHIGEILQQDPAQVRKDLRFVNITGKPKLGFAVEELAAAIREFIGWDNSTDAFLVGVGHLGQALLGYSGFQAHGLKIVAAFDADSAKVGTEINGCKILPPKKLSSLAKRMRVALGIITVPAPAAQAVADQMVAGGIRAIWNFAPVRLEVPEHVLVVNEDLSATLAVLSRKLAK